MNIKEAIEVMKDLKRLSTIPMTLREGIDTILLNKAIDTVLSHINTGNKRGLDDSLQEKSIEVSDSQEGLSYKKDGELPTDEQIEAYALENILSDDSVESVAEMQSWIEGANFVNSKLMTLIQAQDDYIMYLREAIDRVYPHIKPSKYYDSEFLLRGDMIRNKIEEAKNDRLFLPRIAIPRRNNLPGMGH